MSNKKIFLSILLTSLIFSSCTASPTASQTPTTAESVISDTTVSTSAPTSTMFCYPGYLSVSSPYLPTEKGLYEIKNVFPNSASLFYYDYNTRTQIFLCERPECTHDNEACSSFVALPEQEAFAPTLLAVENQLFLVKNASTQAGNASIVTMQKNGSNRKSLLELTTGKTIGREFVSDGNLLFFVIGSMDPQNPENSKLVQLNVINGTMTIITELPFNNLSLVGFDKENLLFQSMGNTMEIYKLNPYKSPKFDKIFSWNVREQAGMVVNTFAYLLSRDSNVVTKHNLETGEEIVVETNIPLQTSETNLVYAFDGNVLLQTIQPNKTSGYTIDIQFANLNSQTVVPHSLRMKYDNKPLLVAGEYGDYLCVMKDMKEHTWITTSQDGTLEEVFDLVREYALILKEDFAMSNPNYLEFSMAVA